MDNFTPGLSEKLVLYLDGTLAASEIIALENELYRNSALQEELDSLRATREAIRIYGLQQKVAGIHAQMMNELQAPVFNSNHSGKRIRYVLAIAASLLLLVGAYWSYTYFTLTPDKVFSSAYQPYELTTTRDGNLSETEIEKAYREKNYTEVIRLHDNDTASSAKTEFLSGLASLALGDDTKAITCLNAVLEKNSISGKSIFNDEAEYYLALSYIKNKDYATALVLLKKIKNDPAHLYHEKVSDQLLRRLNRLQP